MVNNRITTMTDHTEDLVEVHPALRGSVDLAGDGCGMIAGC